MTTRFAAPTAADPRVPAYPDTAPGVDSAEIRGGETSESRRRDRERPNVAPGPWESEILARLKKPECLICREGADTLFRYYFWFLNEQYASVPAEDRLRRARGFCLRHSRHLVAWRAPDQTCTVAGYVLRACNDWLHTLRAAKTPERRRSASPPERLHPATPCPACENEQEAVSRYTWALAECLKRPEVASSYRASYGLCFPHFQEAAPLAGWETLQCLVAEQIRHLEDARAALTAVRDWRMDGHGAAALREAWKRLHGQDLDTRIRPFLAAPRGRGDAQTAPIRDREVTEAAPFSHWSPAFEETRGLLDQPGCSLCRVAARGREEYVTWLEQEIRTCAADEHRWDQTQYLCAAHAWLVAGRCDPQVLAIACDVGLGKAAACLRELQEAIRDPIHPRLAGRVLALPARWKETGRPEPPVTARPHLAQRIRRTLQSLWLTPTVVLRRVRERTLWRNACPLCRHLETIVGRAADRLIAVLGDPEGWRAFGASYGLCLRHAPLLLERAHDPALRRGIADVLRARVEVGCWEAEEFLRKQSWSVRHEPRGAEQTAWLRATARIAGMLDETGYAL